MLKKDIKARPDWFGLDKLVQSEPNFSIANQNASTTTNPQNIPNIPNIPNIANIQSPLTTIKSVES